METISTMNVPSGYLRDGAHVGVGLEGRVESDFTTVGDALCATIAGLTSVLREELSVVLDAMSSAARGDGRDEPQSLPVPTLNSREALDVAAQVERLSRVVEAAQVALAGSVAAESGLPIGEASLAAQHGCANTIELLQRVTRASGRSLARRLRLADRILSQPTMRGERIAPRSPVVAEAVTAGDLSLDCAAMIAEMMEQTEAVADPDALEIAERELVGAAVGSDAALPEHSDNVRTMCKVWKAFLDQNGPEPLETVDERKRGIRLGRVNNGLVRVSGHLLPETAAALGRLLDAMNAPAAQRRGVRFVPVKDESGSIEAGGAAPHILSNARRDSVDGTGEEHEGPTAGVTLEEVCPETLEPRTPDQKRHDAFAAVLAFAMKSPEVPNLGGAPVTVLIQAEAKNLEGRRGTGWVHGFDGALDPVPLSSVRHAACAGSVQRVLQDHRGRIVEIGSPQRVFNAHQRRAITLRDAGCVIPGCTVPATWCEIHHVTEHAAGGPTHTDNGVLLCWYHHWSLDTSGWRIRMNIGVPEVSPPTWIDPWRRWYRTGSPLRAPNIRRTG